MTNAEQREHLHKMYLFKKAFNRIILILVTLDSTMIVSTYLVLLFQL